MSLRQDLSYWKRRLSERTKIFAKSLHAMRSAPRRSHASTTLPEVSIFLSSLNTRQPLELTLLTLLRCTNYPNCVLHIGENASTDGSRAFVENFRCQYPVKVLAVDKPRLHAEWLNDFARTCTSKYWIAVDSDMLFLGRDPIWEMVDRFEANPEVYLVAAEHLPAGSGIEPTDGKFIDFGERPSTWLLAVRSSLRDQLDLHFEFYKNTDGPREFIYDVAGKVLADLQQNGLKYEFMDKTFARKYHHFGSMSWFGDSNADATQRRYKTWQKQFIARRLSRLCGSRAAI